MAEVMSATRQQFPLSTKKVLKKTVTGALAWSIGLLVIFFLTTFVTVMFTGKLSSILLIAGFVILVFLALIVAALYLYQKWYYDVYFYDLTNDYIVIKKGPITPREITIPYERIQDVYVDQDLFDRFFGLYDVHLSSATISSGMEAHIDGVEKEAADGLKSTLLTMVSKKLNRTGQQTPHVPMPEVKQV